MNISKTDDINTEKVRNFLVSFESISLETEMLVHRDKMENSSRLLKSSYEHSAYFQENISR